MRIALSAAVAIAAVTAAVPAGGGPEPVRSAQYVVRVDPRACPSPLCGGYWLALANRARTRCSDGALRPRCYAARALDESRHPLASGVPDGAVARAGLERWSYEGLGELGTLVVAAVRTPVGEAASGTYYLVRDLGIRCVRAPCFSYRAVRLNRRARVALSSLALAGARPTQPELARARAEAATPAGLFVLGRIVRTGDGGVELRASRLYLRAPPPRG